MNSKTIKFFLLLLLGTLLTLSNIYAEGGDKGKSGNTLEKPGSPIRAYMNINFISTIIKNTGIIRYKCWSGCIRPNIPQRQR